MLKTTNEPVSSKNDGSRSAFTRNGDSKPVSWRNDGDGEVDGFGGGGIEYTKKSGKSQSQKMSKSQKLAKSKKQSKSGNSPNFDAMEAGSSFPIPEARAAFDRLRLAFTKAPILWHFDLECYIRIEINVSGYAISSVLS